MSFVPRPSGLLAVVALVAIAPLLSIVALVVLIGMGRPVIFRQIRSGVGGAPFEMVKFRTMRDLRDQSGALLADSDRTPLAGRFLRRSRLDELPELINIARGEMDFVGPRPLLPHTIAAMGADGRLRGAVRPGLTGLAQVNGNTLLSADEKLRFDIWYVRNRTIVMDVMIVVRTLLVIVRGERRTEWYVDEPRHPGRRC